MKSTLNAFELYSCFAIWIITNVYILLKLYQSQSEILEENPDLIDVMTDLQPGWSSMRRLKDTSDVEWSSFKYFIATSWSYLIGQAIVTEIIRRKEISYLKYWYIASSMAFIVFYMGYKQLIMTLAQPLLYAAIIFCNGKKLCVWMTSVGLLLFYNTLKYRTFFWSYLEHDNMNDEEVYLILFSMPWTELRCISFCLDFLDKSNKENTEDSSKIETLVDMMSYCLYVPLLYVGPIVLYENFKKSFTAPCEKLSTRLKSLFRELCIFLTYTLLLDLALHYIYFYAMHVDMKILRMLHPLALCGGGLWMGVQFHIKYVIEYGTTTAMARLDNIETPPTPRCVARIHVYSHMWKYFDVGLYRFLVKYIYIPGIGIISSMYNLPKMANKMIASFVTFSFIFLWHGTIKRIFIWSILNFLGITLEYLGTTLSESDSYKWFKKNVLLTETMETRFTAMLCVPLLFISVISNFYLFAGTKVGDLFLECLYHLSFANWTTIIILIALYCCCVVSMALQDVPSRTDFRKAKVKVASQ